MGQNSLVLFQVWSSSLSDVFVQNQMFVLKKDNKQKLKIKKNQERTQRYGPRGVLMSDPACCSPHRTKGNFLLLLLKERQKRFISLR